MNRLRHAFSLSLVPDTEILAVCAYSVRKIGTGGRPFEEMAHALAIRKGQEHLLGLLRCSPREFLRVGPQANLTREVLVGAFNQNWAPSDNKPQVAHHLLRGHLKSMNARQLAAMTTDYRLWYARFCDEAVELYLTLAERPEYQGSEAMSEAAD